MDGVTHMPRTVPIGVHDLADETDLKATVQVALQQIAEKKYEQALLDIGIEKNISENMDLTLRELRC